MARFHVYRLLSDNILAIDLQSDLLGDLKSRVMAPLYLLEETPWFFQRLTPKFVIEGQTHIVAIQRMAAVSCHEIGEEVADFSSDSDIIIRSLDFLFQGY
jgi:toxin CcdB